MFEFSDRTPWSVLSVDLHPEEPWILGGLSVGTLSLWDYEERVLIDDFYPSPGSPVWSAKFVARKLWAIAGSGDKCIRVYKWYNTSEPLKVISDAHTAAVRCLAVHPTLPYLLSSSDDNTIKLWNWDKDWSLSRVFLGHSASVMHVTFNPKDPHTFACASLDNTVNIWSLGSLEPVFTLGEEHAEGHLDGVFCVEFSTLSDKPYLITCSADHTAKVWDYQTKRCIQTLEGHTDVVTTVCYHPVLPIIITVTEDATALIWNATTFRLENNTLDVGSPRCFAIAHMEGSNRVVFGCLYGPQMMKLSLEIPLACMDNTGTIIWAKHKEILIGKTTDLMMLSQGDEFSDLERLPWDFDRWLTTFDFCPESLKHSPDGKYVIVCGDGKYTIINSSFPWKVVSSGSALEIVWSSDGGYALRQSSSHIEIFNKNFEKKGIVTPPYSVEHIFDGTSLAISSSNFLEFYDWEKLAVSLRIDVTKTRDLYYSDSGDLVAIVSDSSFKILDLNCDGDKTLSETNHDVRTGVWVKDTFVYITAVGELIYCVGRSKATRMCILRRPMSLMVCKLNASQVYLMDEEFNLFGYTLPTSLIDYKRLVLRGQLAKAVEAFTSIPKEKHKWHDVFSLVALFLEDLQLAGFKSETPEDFAKEEELWIELGYVPPGTVF
ncbi:unnamed protein product [Arabidopsis arenosa]|uniref:COPA/B second beta-propeller domain-containing protein n=1 Tax=Arabidopsis arenosa TaxID=38785 RepID=A0A8S1ZNQ2_ARAAE|nr:unnamed protein product [Arabidopsis arenosa]